MYSPETTTVMDLRSVRLAAHVVLKVVIINMYRILGVIPKEGARSVDKGVHLELIMKWIMIT